MHNLCFRTKSQTQGTDHIYLLQISEDSASFLFLPHFGHVCNVWPKIIYTELLVDATGVTLVFCWCERRFSHILIGGCKTRYLTSSWMQWIPYCLDFILSSLKNTLKRKGNKTGTACQIYHCCFLNDLVYLSLHVALGISQNLPLLLEGFIGTENY